jgi:hypothetical protein
MHAKTTQLLCWEFPKTAAAPCPSPGLPAIVIAGGVDLLRGRPIGANDEQCAKDNEYEARQEAGNEEDKQIGHLPPRSMGQAGAPLCMVPCTVDSLISASRQRSYAETRIQKPRRPPIPMNKRSQPFETMSMSIGAKRPEVSRSEHHGPR